MTGAVILFYILSAVAVLAALGILLVRNVLHGAFLLMLSFFCVAGIYVLGNASFIGVTQLLVYVGGILILMIFGIMLTNKLKGQALISESHNQVLGVVLGGGFFVVFCYVLFTANFEALQLNKSVPENTVQTIGIEMMSKYLVPFEVVAILLLIALIGAAVISERRKEGQQ